MNSKWTLRFATACALMLAGWTAIAQEPPAEPTAKEMSETLQNNLNIVWTLVAAALVFFMQAGFAKVEAGFTRAKNACNIVMKNMMDFSVGAVMWFLVGFAFMFGKGNSFIGLDHFAASDFSVSDLNWTFWIFQCVFAGTAATIVSGAMAGRTKFTGYLAYSAVICAVIYPIAGHWAWSSLYYGEGVQQGWLVDLGFLDFAGSTVVHSCGAWLALAGAIVLGPRKGKYTPDGKSNAIPGHNIPLAALGVFILWFGWFGFNCGSTTTGDSSVGYIAMTTTLAAAAGAILAMVTSWFRFKKPDVGMTLNGALAGLVAITAGCDAVSMSGALVLGGVAGILVVFAVEFIDKVLKIDGPVGAVSVHGVCGAWGTLGLCFFIDGGFTMKQFLVQLAGVGAMFGWAFGLGLVVFTLIKFTIGLRASDEEEARGLDFGEHGNEAYSGFQIFSNQ